MSCRELVELVTDYLEGRLPDATRQQLEAHLADCDNCTAYIQQMRLTLHALGHIPEATISMGARDDLMTAFRYLRTNA